jgi:SAM-dependent methyltransferase
MGQNDPLNNVIDRSLNYGRHLISHMLRLANRKPMRVVLDIGAGGGSDLLLARAQNPSCEVHAIEVYPEYQRALEQNGITVHRLNVERDKFPFVDESVDVVIANQILEHVKEIFWILHEVSRVLRVGGFFVIGVPNLASLHNRLLLLLGKQPTCLQNHSAHVRGYTRGDLLKFVDLSFPKGYSLVKFGGSNFYPFPAFLAKPLAFLFPNMAWSIFLMFRKERVYRGEILAYPLSSQLETNFYLGNG